MDPSHKRAEAEEDAIIAEVDHLATEVGISALLITKGRPKAAVAALILAATRTAAACGVSAEDLVGVVQKQYPIAKIQADADPPFPEEDRGDEAVRRMGN
jgi:hypothetical protein